MPNIQFLMHTTDILCGLCLWIIASVLLFLHFVYFSPKWCWTLIVFCSRGNTDSFLRAWRREKEVCVSFCPSPVLMFPLSYFLVFCCLFEPCSYVSSVRFLWPYMSCLFEPKTWARIEHLVFSNCVTGFPAQLQYRFYFRI